MMSALYHSIVLFFGGLLIWESTDILFTDGKVADMYNFGNLILTVGVCVVFFKAVLEINYFTWITHLGLWGPLLIYYGIFGIESLMLTFIPNQYGQFGMVMSMPAYWLFLILGTATCLIP